MIWNILVLIPKGRANTWVIWMLEVLWKVVEAIIDTRIKMVVKFHDISNQFHSNRGTGTAIMDLNMAQEVESIHQGKMLLVILDL